jgi:hypothetical protein
MKRPGRAATGAYSEWILLSAIRSNANSLAANCTKGCALDHTAMPLCVLCCDPDHSSVLLAIFGRLISVLYSQPGRETSWN